MTSRDAPPDHALAVLEFPRVLERIAAYATSAPGRRATAGLRPLTALAAVDEALSLTDEMIGLQMRLERWAPPAIPDAGRFLKVLRVDGSVLDAEQLAGLLSLLASSRLLRADLRRFPDDLPRLAGLAERLVRLTEQEQRLERSLDPRGGLADGASPELARIRKDLRGGRSALVRRLERFAGQLPERHQVADASVTIRTGRYCVPVRREGRAQIGGIVHDESATGQTVYVEPPEAIEPMNRIADLERAERREEQRILRDLTERLRPHAHEVTASLAALAEADSLYARARYALDHGGSRPEIVAEVPESGPAYRAVDARHPLLDEGGEPVVPFHLDLGADERVLLISGPNAGGKTVLLKAVGLLSALAQSGIVPPVGEGTRFPLFRSFHALIGDEQSIQASLSTFSAQVEGLRRILEEADGDALVLVDELGGNTDPAEGGALAAAVLQRLASQAGLSVVTTHLGELKDLAAAESAIVNASLQFDTTAMRPTFRLVRDRPGRSYALEIARRLGLPADVLEAAAARLSGEERQVEALLSDLEERAAEADRLTVRARASERRSRRTGEELEQALDRVRRRERELEREARRRAERYLLEARREVEREIEQLRAAARAAGERESERPDLDAAVRAARSGVERRLRESRAARARLDDTGESAPADLGPGDGARSRSLSVEGIVREVREGEAMLDAGGVRFTLPIEDLEPWAGADRGARRAPADPLPEIAPVTEIDLRGLRVEEVEAALAHGLDAAILHDLPTLRIIHGKGTGALRGEVERLLEGDPRVRFHRPGGFQEGGSGVTVVKFGGTTD